MAVKRREEILRDAWIDMEDGTITEFSDDKTDIHDIYEVLSRWAGVPNVTIRFTSETKEDSDAG